MSFKLLAISSIYPGYIDAFISGHHQLKDLDYESTLKLLIENSTEFVASYNKAFNKLGIKADCIIANAGFLQHKWKAENGLKDLDYQSTLLEQIKKNKPDVLFLEDIRYLDSNWFSLIKKEVKSLKKIVAYHCAPFNSEKLKLMGLVDFVFTCTPGLKMEFESLGIKSFQVYHGFDNTLLPKISGNNNYSTQNLVFTGSLFNGVGYHNQRIELIETIINEKIDISLYLNLEKIAKIRAKQVIYFVNSILRKIKLDKLISLFPVLELGNKIVNNYPKSIYKSNQGAIYGLEMYKLLAKSNIILNNHADVAGKYAGNMRLFEATGVGSCLLTDNKTNMPELFDIDNEVFVYKGIDDCLEKLKWLIENKAQREKIALAGNIKTLNNHTVEKRSGQIIEIITNQLAN